MAEMGLPSYRFSISWPRIVPSGRVEDGISEEGIAYYNGLIDALIANDILPVVTLYHWDLPQALLQPHNVTEPTYGWYSVDGTGRPNGQIVEHFVAYADICFERFGDRVKTWTTFNEPWTFLYLGSGNGKAPSID